MGIGDDGCYFTKQPSTPEEVEVACRAVWVSCVAAVRYRGNDEAILQRLYDLGTYESCDRKPSERELGVVAYMKKAYRGMGEEKIHWTFLRERRAGGDVAAVCFGPYPHGLAIFSINSSGEVALLRDDLHYRPKEAEFRRSWKLTMYERIKNIF